MRLLRGASLVEAIVASVLLLLVFSLSLQLLPRLRLGGGDGAQAAHARHRAEQARRKYGSGLWPPGTYLEEEEGVRVEATIAPYRDFEGIVSLRIAVCVDGTKAGHTELIAWDK